MSSWKLLVLDTSFSYEAIVTRGLQSSVTCRDLDGFFQHVWSVHPFASLVTSASWSSEFGGPITYVISKAHTFIEGKVGISRMLVRFSMLNFFLAQAAIFYQLAQLIRVEKISVIRVGDPLYLGLLGYALSKITRVPLVVRVGSNNEKIREITGKTIMPRLFRSILQERFVEKFVLSRADLVAGANEDNLQFAKDCGANPARCTLFRYGNLIDAVHFEIPSLRSVPCEDFVTRSFLLCIARLELVKKVDDVVRVLAAVRGKGFDITAVIVGEGRERGSLQSLASQLGILDHVVFCGNKDQQWLARVIPHAAVVLSPHTGRALTEAALGAAPIAAYDVDWQSELIQTGFTGEIVPFGDWQALSVSTIKLLQDPDYALGLGTNVRAKVLEMMDPEKLNQHERKQYIQLLKKTSPY